MVPFRLSSELVPRNISSNNTKAGLSANSSIICFKRLISAKKYDSLSDKESDNRIETKTGNGCTFALLAQTGEPIPDKTILIPKLRKKVLLPDIFEPVKIMND
ncbi:hypothetical protein D3C87_1614650 [compost metagenome]